VEDFQMVRDRRPGERRHFGNLPDIKSLPRLEQQQDALPVFVAQGNEDLRHGQPFGGDRLGVIGFHIDNLRYIDMSRVG
jgi:hypothetical protein